MGEHRVSTEIVDKFNIYLNDLQDLGIDQIDDIYFRTISAMSACVEQEVYREYTSQSTSADEFITTDEQSKRYYNGVHFVESFHVLRQLGDYFLVIRQNGLVHELYLADVNNTSQMEVRETLFQNNFWLELLTANPEEENEYSVAYSMLIGGEEYSNYRYASNLESFTDESLTTNKYYAKQLSTNICSFITEGVHEEYGLDFSANQ